ncbi:MAG: YdcF family protein [Hellea sp.]
MNQTSKRQRPKLSPAAKRKGWLKFAVFMAVLTLFIFAAGFVTFAYKVDNLRPPLNVAKADGIVVWTGKGGGRLETGADLLRRNKGERLLISGVNERTSLDAIKDLVILPDARANCCIDLDYKAEDTIGNARETASWAKALGYEHIILVTSAYHMPRAEIEIGAAAGRIKITAYPVINSDGTKWYGSGARFKRLFQEYGKLLLSYLRSPATKATNGAPLLGNIPPQDTPISKP